MGYTVCRDMGQLKSLLYKQRHQSEYKTKAWSHESEYPIMLALAQLYQVDNVIECGTCGGASAVTWAFALLKAGIQGGKIYTWDVRNKRKVYDEVKFGHMVVFHNESFSENAGPVISEVGGKRLFFIDGSHWYEDVCKDLELVFSHVREGDVLVLHDAMKIPVVRTALSDVMLNFSDREIRRRSTITTPCGFEVVEF